MKFLSALVGLALLVESSWAKKCQDISVPVTISATNIAFNLAPPANNIEAIDFILNITQPAGTFGPSIARGVSNRRRRGNGYEANNLTACQCYRFIHACHNLLRARLWPR